MISKILIALGLIDREYKTYEEYRQKAEAKATLQRLNEIRKRRVDNV